MKTPEDKIRRESPFRRWIARRLMGSERRRGWGKVRVRKYRLKRGLKEIEKKRRKQVRESRRRNR